jgi:hypothetical protein
MEMLSSASCRVEGDELCGEKFGLDMSADCLKAKIQYERAFSGIDAKA